MPSLEEIGGIPGGPAVRAFLQQFFTDQMGAGGGLNLWLPNDAGFVGWNYDIGQAAATLTLVNGTAYYVAIPIRNTVTVSKVWWSIQAAAVTPTAGQNFFSLYANNGDNTASLRASADATGALTSTGPQGVAITPQTLTPGIYYAAIMTNAATPPHIHACNAPANPNLAVAASRAFLNGTGLTTTIPSSITLGSNTGQIYMWAGLS